MTRPLEGIRVLEIAVWHAGPGAGAILADLGAEVIKIESPGGDPERTVLGSITLRTQDVDRDDWNVLYDMSNHGKKSVRLDIGSEAGRDIVRRLTAESDVFLTNLRPSTKKKLGIDYETLAAVNPRLVHVNVTGLGSEGDRADHGAFDTLGQAASGMMWAMAGESPVPLPGVTLDHMTSTMAANGAITALLARERGGTGTDVHVSLYGSGVWAFFAWITATAALGRLPDLTYNRRRKSPMLSIFECADGRWIVGTNPGTKPWANFCEAVGRPDLIDGGLHLADLDDLERIYGELEPIFRTRTASEWVDDVFVPRGIMFSPVQTFQDVLADPQALANGYVVPVAHPVLGDVTLPVLPIAFGNYEMVPRGGSAELGEHNDEIFARLGLTTTEIAALNSDPAS